MRNRLRSNIFFSDLICDVSTSIGDVNLIGFYCSYVIRCSVGLSWFPSLPDGGQGRINMLESARASINDAVQNNANGTTFPPLNY